MCFSPTLFYVESTILFHVQNVGKNAKDNLGLKEMIPSHLYFLFTFITKNCLWLFVAALIQS